MRVMVRWLMAVVGLLAVLSMARIASAAEKEQPSQGGQATPGIADEVHAIQDAEQGRDRGEAVSEAARGQDHGGSSGGDGGQEPVEVPPDDGSTK